MTTTHDFDDGNGPVAAHQHPNGGGWVADTAGVAETAYVGPDARVFGYARMYDNARMYGYARMSGHASMSGDARMSAGLLVGGSWATSPYGSNIGRWYAYDAGDGHFGVGCQMHSIGYWLGHLDTIAAENGATDLERELARLTLHTVCLLRGIEVPT